MSKVMSLASHYVQQVSKLFVSVCFGAAFILTVYQVFSRFVLSSSWMLSIFPGANRFTFIWIEEAIRYLFVWGVFIGAAVVYKLRQHATVELVTHMLPAKVKTVLSAIVELICIGFFILLIAKGWDIAKVAGIQRSPSLKINMFYMYSSIVVCSAFCLIHSVNDLVNILSGRASDGNDDNSSPANEVHA